MIKRIFDFSLALSGLLLVSPLFLVLPILIKLDSQGPVFFRQARIGKGLQGFSLYKFRTMIQDASQEGGVLTIGNDARITKVGAILRRFKLDELPQLFNILKGEMSFVGPRPEVPSYVEIYRSAYEKVMTVKPGLTDLASLKYMDEAGMLNALPNPREEYEKKILPDKIKLAKWYIKKSSFLFDLAIIMETVLRLIGIRSMLVKIPEDRITTQRTILNQSMVWNKIMEYRRWGIVAFHLGLVGFANYMAFILRFDGQIPSEQHALFVQTIPCQSKTNIHQPQKGKTTQPHR